jgi:hypothetical protein
MKLPLHRLAADGGPWLKSCIAGSLLLNQFSVQCNNAMMLNHHALIFRIIVAQSVVCAYVLTIAAIPNSPLDHSTNHQVRIMHEVRALCWAQLNH